MSDEKKPVPPNDKDMRWVPPVDLPSVSSEDYDVNIKSSRGSAQTRADKAKADGGPPDYTMPGLPTAPDKAE